MLANQNQIQKRISLVPKVLKKKYSKIKTIKQAVNSNSTCLSKIKKILGEKQQLNLIRIWIIELNEFANVKNPMLPDQINEVSEMISQDYYYFKLAEINLLFENIKRGRYGQFYESLNGLKIMSWFDEYDKERMGLIDNENYSKHLDSKNRYL